MRPKNKDHARARDLRRKGWPLRRIANELRVAISSVSVWVRDIDPPARATTSALADPGVVEMSGEMRTCGKCRQRLPVENFNRHHENGRQHWCRECFAEYFRARGDTHRSQSGRAKLRRKLAARLFINEYFASHPCVDCGETDMVVLEFDHLREKNAAVSVLVCDGWSPGRLRKEIALCEVVCVNCHRRRTARRGASWRTDPWALETRHQLLPGELRNMQLVRDTLCTCGCVDCGLRDVLVLDFDHVGPKRGNVTVLARRGCSLMVLERELARCEIRCGNCHRRRTLTADRRVARAA